MIRPSEMVRLLKRYEWPALAAGAIWATALLLYGLLLGPRQWTVMERGRAWENGRRDVAELETLVKTVDDLAALRKRLPEKKDFATIVSFLSQIARSDRLSIPSVAYKSDKESKEGYTKLTMTFTVSGHYADIRRFIADVESADSFLVIEDLGLNSESKGSDLELKIEMSTFFQDSGG